MIGLTRYQVEGMLAWLANLAWVTALMWLMYAHLRRGFTRYPWPTWARRRRGGRA